MKAIDLTGKRYGRLIVVRKARNRGRRTCWLCRCDCGNEVTATTDLLRRGSVKSCGCLNRENRLGSDLTGQIFGRLTVVGLAGIRNKETYWTCKCSCGNLVEVARQRLINNLVVSCGCLHREKADENRKKTYFRGTNIGLIRSNILHCRNKTGVRGVCFHKKSGKYMAQIRVQNREIYLGLFPTIQEAAKARKKAEEVYFAPLIEDYENKK